jgi:hypothetical protein
MRFHNVHTVICDNANVRTFVGTNPSFYLLDGNARCVR